MSVPNRHTAGEERKLDALRLIYDMHLTDPEPSTYDLGFVNGIAIAISILTGQPPKYVYKDRPTTVVISTFTEAPDTTAGEPE